MVQPTVVVSSNFFTAGAIFRLQPSSAVHAKANPMNMFLETLSRLLGWARVSVDEKPLVFFVMW